MLSILVSQLEINPANTIAAQDRKSQLLTVFHTNVVGQLIFASWRFIILGLTPSLSYSTNQLSLPS
jgi:hypothetical protein